MIVERKKGQWSESAARVLKERYLWRKDGTLLEDEDGMCARVARAVAEAERTWGAGPAEVERIADQFYQVMIDRQFMPNSPTLMNAGKDNGQQLSACFVLPVGDSLPEIFDAIKHAAIIHKSGGGCISGDAHVFTTFCGVETISTLYERVRSTGIAEETRDGHAVMDVGALGIRTMALDPDRGTYTPAPVSHLWRYDVPLSDQLCITCANGLEVTTSSWHPFMIFDGRRFVERRADELQPGDLLATPNASVRDHWPHHTHREVAGMVLDEDIAWLLGYYLGDGSLGWAKVPESDPRREKLRWRLFDGRTASLERARAILAARFDVHVQVACDARGLYSLTSTDTAFITRFRQLLDVRPGPKEDLPFPEMVAKSPLPVVGAFLAGLVDADGYADSIRHQVTFTTTSEGLARKVHTLCALLGLAPGIRTREPYGKGRVVCYEVRLAAEPRIADLRAVLGNQLTDTLKAGRLAAMEAEHGHVTAPRLPIPFSAVEDMLHSLGIATATTAIHRQPVLIGDGQFWLQNWKEGRGVSAETLLPLIAALRPRVTEQYQGRLDLLERILTGGTVVRTIERPTTNEPFYDFTVEGFSTYLAGSNGLTAIHNTGFGLSRLRSEGSEVATTRGVASGPVSFLRVFNAATEAVKQGGTRRGANMGVLRVDHPDILKFIDCKRPDPVTGVRDITNFNISVAATDAFMDALARRADYDLRDPHSGKITGQLNAREVFDKICAAAWSTGDPGLLFIDRANNSASNPIPELEQIEATNPCGEQWLGGYDACNLGSINLAECVARQADGIYAVDWTELERVTRVTTRFLDNVIEINPLPLAEINQTVRANRRVGLGIMGWADLLFLLAIPYDSERALALAEEVMRFINRFAHDESQVLARSRGAFPNFARSIYRDGPPMRNATLTTVAPTGTISIIADCSSGIEPVFALAFTHVVDRGKPTERRLVLSNPIFARIASEQGFHSEALMEKVSEHGSVHGLAEVPEHWQQVFVNAHEVTPDWHIKMQAAFQRGVDNSISKTVNVPNESTVQDIEDAYLMAWAEGCKGITVFRDGCLSTGQVLNVGTKQAKPTEVAAPAPAPVPETAGPVPVAAPPSPVPATVKPRPPVVFGYTRQVRAPEGTANITINTDETGPVEVFLSVGRAGSDIAALAEALGRLISLTLRLPSPIEPDERLRLIATQLRGIGGSRSIGFGANRVLSLPDALAQAFMSHLEQGLSRVPAPITRPMNGNGHETPTQLTLPTGTMLGNLCPQCGSSGAFVLEEGCKKCHGCGYSEC